MKKVLVGILILSFFLSACGHKPYYKTAKGKRKQRYYNDLQFGGGNKTPMKKIP